MNNSYTKSSGTASKPSNRKPSFKRRPARGGVKKKAVSKIDPKQLVKKASGVEIQDFRAERTFKDMPLHPDLLKQIEAKGYERPSEIQDKTFETLMEGQDMLGIAQTGTGKTAAFLIPVIEQLLDYKAPSHTLIVVPTRELASQVLDEFNSLTKGLNLTSACFIGGTNINTDLRVLKRGLNVIIGTPGRLLDLKERKAINFNKFQNLILDEFDRMLDMGFKRDMDKIIYSMPKRKQSMLFSATLDKTQQLMIDNILKNYATVKISTGTTSSDNIDQDVVRVSAGQDKFKILFDMLSRPDFSRVILFEETKHKVNRLCQKLNKIGITAEQIQGNKSQNARQNALNNFKAGKVQVLVATDVAARGIDVNEVTHVINYQIPLTYDSYIHRIGRTGRAGQVGKAFTFIDA